MTPGQLTVPLRGLDTDVDVLVHGPDADALAAGVRERWHLCLRDDAARSADGEGEPPVPLSLSRGTSAGSARARTTTEVSGGDETSLFTGLTHAVTGAVIRAQSGRLLMLHAAALADRDTGATLVAVAPGGTGKSTLCTTLGAGRVYLTDETVGIRPDGSVAPYPKPVSLRREASYGKDEVPPARLGLDGPSGRPWVAGVVLLRRVPDHRGEALVEPMGTLDAIAALAPESSAFMVTDRPLTWLAGLLEDTGGARRVTYADTASLAGLVDEVLGRRR